MVDSYQQEFGRRVRQLRITRGHTQESLAGLAGIHVTHVSGIERGVRNPSLKSVRALALALDVPVADLFPPGNLPPRPPLRLNRNPARLFWSPGVNPRSPLSVPGHRRAG